MKYLILLMPIVAVWLLSANEQGEIGSWGYWTSFIIMGALVALVHFAKRRGR